MKNEISFRRAGNSAFRFWLAGTVRIERRFRRGKTRHHFANIPLYLLSVDGIPRGSFDRLKDAKQKAFAIMAESEVTA